MKKFGKFLFGALSLAAAAGGIYCLYKKRINKDADADFDDFEDDEEEDEEDLTVSADPEDREYVSITISSDEGADETAAEDKDTAAKTAAEDEAAKSADPAAE